MLYEIAEHRLRLTFNDDYQDDSLLPSLKPFQVPDDGEEALLEIVVDDGLGAVPLEKCRLIRDIDTGNGMTAVYRFPYKKIVEGTDEMVATEGYQFLIRNIHNTDCALFVANEDFRKCRCALRGNQDARRYALNSVVMLSYAFASAPYDTLLIHASVVRHKGKGYAFTAKSGTGKSTQVSNWLRYIPDCDLLNDDNPVIRVKEEGVFIYGSPWSGKTPCYRNLRAPLGTIAKITRDSANFLEKKSATKQYGLLLPAISSMKWDERNYLRVGDTLAKVVEKVPVFNLHCLPDIESAIVASEGMSNPDK